MWTCSRSTTIAAEVFGECDRALQGHAERTAIVIGGEEIGRRSHFVDALPAAAIVRFQEGGEAGILEDLLPVQRIFQIPHGEFGSAVGMLFVGQEHCGRYRDPQFRGQCVVEKLVVGAPPEGIVDDFGSGEYSVLEEGPVEGDIVRDAIDDEVVAAGYGDFDAAGLEVLGDHAFDAHRVDVIHQCWRERILHPV